MANISDRKLLRIAASKKAAALVKSTAFTVVLRGRQMKPEQVFKRGAFVVASWWGENKTLACMGDGTLMMLMGEIAVQVNAPRRVLETVFQPHYDSKWWRAGKGSETHVTDRAA